jgi:hypothetical protein
MARNDPPSEWLFTPEQRNGNERGAPGVTGVIVPRYGDASDTPESGYARSPLKAVRFSEMEPAGKRDYVVERLVPEGHHTILYGDGGAAKSTLALSISLAVSRADGGSWLGFAVQTAPVLYLDFELDAQEQNRRVRQLSRAEGLSSPPEGLIYLCALGCGAREAFDAALAECQKYGVRLMVLDSVGPALGGDAEAAKDVLAFYREVLEGFRVSGVTVLLIDHQAKGGGGESYQAKRSFGSVYKGNLARSTVQAEAVEHGEGSLTVRLRQNKHNFGPLAEPFGVKLGFSEEMISAEAIELDAADLAEERTLNSTDRVKLALGDSPAYPEEIAEHTGLATRSVKNTLSKLRKKREIEDTGETKGQSRQVSLVSLPLGDSDSDTSSANGVNGDTAAQTLFTQEPGGQWGEV